MNNKKKNGQFFTTTNPFNNDLFYKWKNLIPNFGNEILIEPFAGSNNIPLMLSSLKINNKWACFDIDPPMQNNYPRFTVEKRNVLEDFPNVSNIAITNPPYLAKNSAVRDGIYFPANAKYDDLYKISLDVMLSNCDFVAAIIPESFITQGIFHSRLFGVISLTCKMFDDTECPVCLAFFVPEKIKKDKLSDLEYSDFFIYKDSAYWGKFSQAKENYISFEVPGWKFNEPNGLIGLYAIDNTKQQSIAFVNGNEISPEKIKSTSRGITRIGNEILINNSNVDKVINLANEILNDYRIKTSDIFLTSFRGLRNDGQYRRRLDFNQARKILSQAIRELGYE